MKQHLKLLALLALLLLPLSSAVETPKGIDGHVYALDGITPVPRAVTLTIDNTDTGEQYVMYVGRGGVGRYSVALPWGKGAAVRITVENPVHNSSREEVLMGIHRNVDLFLNMTLPDLPPAILSDPIVAAVQDQFYAYQLDVFEWNAQLVQHGLLDGPSGMTVNITTGLIQWVPTAYQIGEHTVSYIATDGNLSTVQNFNITVENVNDAPTFLTLPTTSVKQDIPWTYTVMTEDLDADPVIVTLSGPSTMVLAAGNTTWTPGPYDVGVHNVTLTASDGLLETDQSFLLTVINVPDAPIITSAPVLNATEDVLYTYAVVAEDPDNDSLTVLVDGPAGMTVNGSTLYWTPGDNGVGTNNISITVTDGVLTAEQQYALHVRNVNDAPVIPISIEMPTLKKIALYQFASRDVDGDELTFTLLKSPSGFTISPAGFVRYEPAKERKFTFTVAVSDGIVNITAVVDVKLISFKNFVRGSSGGGGGGIVEYFSEFLPPEGEHLFERTYSFSKFITSLFVRGNVIPDTIRLVEVTPDVPMDRVVHGYFRLDGVVEGLDRAEMTFTVPQSWLDTHEVSIDKVSLYRYDGKWRSQRTKVDGTTLTARVRGFGLFAIAADAPPKAQEPTVITIAEPVTILGKVIGGRKKLSIVLTDLTTGEQYETKVGRGKHSDVFEFVLHDVSGHEFVAEIDSLFSYGRTEFVADTSLVAIEIRVGGVLTGRVIGLTNGQARYIELLLVLIITAALSVRYVRRRII